MKTLIETNKKFVFRLEDFIYIFSLVYLIPFGFAIYQITKHSQQKNSTVIPVFSMIFVGFAIVSLLIYLSYRKRIRDQYYIEDESIVRERDGKEIFRIPFGEIVSVRVYNKKGTQGSIIFYTDQSSKHLSYSYFPLNNMVPLSIYGLTKKKINLITNRKGLLTQIYLINPNLHFIE